MLSALFGFKKGAHPPNTPFREVRLLPSRLDNDWKPEIIGPLVLREADQLEGYLSCSSNYVILDRKHICVKECCCGRRSDPDTDGSDHLFGLPLPNEAIQFTLPISSTAGADEKFDLRFLERRLDLSENTALATSFLGFEKQIYPGVRHSFSSLHLFGSHVPGSIRAGEYPVRVLEFRRVSPGDTHLTLASHGSPELYPLTSVDFMGPRNGYRIFCVFTKLCDAPLLEGEDSFFRELKKPQSKEYAAQFTILDIKSQNLPEPVAIGSVASKLSTSKTKAKSLWGRRQDFSVEHGLLHQRVEGVWGILLSSKPVEDDFSIPGTPFGIGTSTLSAFVKLAHDGSSTGLHRSTGAMVSYIEKRGTHERLHQLCQEHYWSCLICSAVGYNVEESFDTPQRTETHAVGRTLGIDLISGIPGSDYTELLTMTDLASDAVWAVPLKGFSHGKIAKAVVSLYISQREFWHTIRCDNYFTTAFITLVNKDLKARTGLSCLQDITLRNMPSYLSRANPCERSHKPISKLLRIYMDWDIVATPEGHRRFSGCVSTPTYPPLPPPLVFDGRKALPPPTGEEEPVSPSCMDNWHAHIDKILFRLAHEVKSTHGTTASVRFKGRDPSLNFLADNQRTGYYPSMDSVISDEASQLALKIRAEHVRVQETRKMNTAKRNKYPTGMKAAVGMVVKRLRTGKAKYQSNFLSNLFVISSLGTASATVECLNGAQHQFHNPMSLSMLAPVHITLEEILLFLNKTFTKHEVLMRMRDLQKYGTLELYGTAIYHCPLMYQLLREPVGLATLSYLDPKCHLMSFNCDGLIATVNKAERCKTLKLIRSRLPEVLFLQEIKLSSRSETRALQALNLLLPEYVFSFSYGVPGYSGTGVAIHRSRIHDWDVGYPNEEIVRDFISEQAPVPLQDDLLRACLQEGRISLLYQRSTGKCYLNVYSVNAGRGLSRLETAVYFDRLLAHLIRHYRISLLVGDVNRLNSFGSADIRPSLLKYKDNTPSVTTREAESLATLLQEVDGRVNSIRHGCPYACFISIGDYVEKRGFNFDLVISLDKSSYTVSNLGNSRRMDHCLIQIDPDTDP